MAETPTGKQQWTAARNGTPDGVNGANRTQVAVYDYRTTDDTLAYQVVRYEPKTFRQRRPNLAGDGWIWDLDQIPRIPYRHPQLEIACEDGQTVWIVEGEKDADRLHELGLTATTSAQGANWTWPPEWADHFKGAERAVIIPDNDQAGYDAAQQRAAVLSLAVADVRILQLPDLPHKGDITDWLDQGGTLPELWELAEQAPQFNAPPLLETGPDPDDEEPEQRLLVYRWVTDIIDKPPPEPPVLVDGMLRAGELAVLGAHRAIGKSWAAMNLSALLGRGEGFMFGALRIRQACRVLLAQGELDEWGSWYRWKMLTGHAGPPINVAESFDRWRIRIVKRRTTGGDRDTGTAWTDEWYDAVLDGRLEHTIARLDIGLLIIDPWAVYYAGSENSNDETEAALDKLRELSMRYGTAILILHHLSKSNDQNREPEDMWRGAGRLADWASTRITMLPHFNEKQAANIGLTRRHARRYMDVHFLRRSAPTDDISTVLNHETGWWDRWTPHNENTLGTRAGLNPIDVANICAKTGGDWPSSRRAAEDLGVAPETARKLLAPTIHQGLLETYDAGRGATGYRIPTPKLTDPDPYSDENLFNNNPQ